MRRPIHALVRHRLPAAAFACLVLGVVAPLLFEDATTSDADATSPRTHASIAGSAAGTDTPMASIDAPVRTRTILAQSRTSASLFGAPVGARLEYDLAVTHRSSITSDDPDRAAQLNAEPQVVRCVARLVVHVLSSAPDGHVELVARFRSVRIETSAGVADTTTFEPDPEAPFLVTFDAEAGRIERYAFAESTMRLRRRLARMTFGAIVEYTRPPHAGESWMLEGIHDETGRFDADLRVVGAERADALVLERTARTRRDVPGELSAALCGTSDRTLAEFDAIALVRANGARSLDVVDCVGGSLKLTSHVEFKAIRTAFATGRAEIDPALIERLRAAVPEDADAPIEDSGATIERRQRLTLDETIAVLTRFAAAGDLTGQSAMDCLEGLAEQLVDGSVSAADVMAVIRADSTTEIAELLVSALGAAGANGDHGSIDAMTGLLGDGTLPEGLRMAVLCSAHRLGAYGQQFADRVLLGLATNDLPGDLLIAGALATGSIAGALSSAANPTIAEGGARVLGELRRWAEGNDQMPLWLNARRNAAVLGMPLDAAEVTPYLNADSVDVRASAAAACAHLPPQSRDAALLPRLAVEEPDVRHQIYRGLQKGPATRAAIDALAERLAYESDADLRSGIVRTFGRWSDDPSAREHLVRIAADDPSTELRDLARGWLEAQ